MTQMIYYGQELYHHGIFGQKWGVRRWQNEDGSLTPAGREHYGYYGKSGDKFKASNGLTVGKPKNAAVAAFRRAQATKVGSKVLEGTAKLNNKFYGFKNGDQIVNRVKKENEAVRESVKAMKETKKEKKEAVKYATKQAFKNASLLDKLTYNYATYRETGKKMVNKNMSYEDALKATKKEAWRNTAIYGAVMAGLTVAELYAMNNY